MVDWEMVRWVLDNFDLPSDVEEILALAYENREQEGIEYVLYNFDLPSDVELALAEAVEG